MEIEQESTLNSRGKKIGNCILTYWLFFTVMLLTAGINMTIVGAVCYSETKTMQYAFILATGLLIMSIAVGICTRKGMKRYRLGNLRSEPTFQVFTNENEEFEMAFDKEQSPLEMSDQHLPSGVLRLKEDS